jgi:pimeloyl-ACP methyl ester carboxylesterase
MTRSDRPVLKFREHGPRRGTPEVVVLHGGPGAPGSAGALADLIADPARVLEPWQQATTVADHVEDMRSFITAHCDARPVLVGHSWGAMLALALAAAHPLEVRGLCLVGSGTFDLRSRAVFQAAAPSADYVDALPEDALDSTVFDERAHELSWNDMVRLQSAGIYPASFAAIAAPVVMLHGASDPHPGRMIRDSLRPFLPQLEYRELDRCGHYPWRERHARDELARLAREWLATFETAT